MKLDVQVDRSHPAGVCAHSTARAASRPETTAPSMVAMYFCCV
jgi:hypothetical protein